MGPKLGIALPKVLFRKGALIEITVSKGDKEKIFLTKFNRILTLRRHIVNSLNLNYSDLVYIKIRKIGKNPRSKDLFKGNRLDLLALIPKKTSRGYRIFVNPFKKKDKDWLRIWYSHSRGSGKQIELKRFIEIKTLGTLLGQYQAEGTKHQKSQRKFSVEFKNKLIKEHREFLDSLFDMGLSRDLINFYFGFNPEKLSKKQIKEEIRKFQSQINYPVRLSPSKKCKGSAFGLIIRNVLLTEIILFSLDKIRIFLANQNKYSLEKKELVNCFFAKLLTGDGTLDSRCNTRKFPHLQIKIVDKDINYLHDYSQIMKNLGFHPRINLNRIYVISGCSFKNLLYLYQSKAFKNTNNWNKLLVSIKLCLENGRRSNTYYRFLQLEKQKIFTNLSVSNDFNIQLRTANSWLHSKKKENLVIQTNKSQWTLTKKGKELVSILKEWQKDYNKLVHKKKIKDPAKLLVSLKPKSKYNSE